jgi:mono/diheme cytochrome c family protein
MKQGLRCGIAFLLLSFAVFPAYSQDLVGYSGEELYQRFCAACHGTAGQGDGPVASSLAVLVPDLTRLYQRHGETFPGAQVREIIDGRSVVVAHGTRVMPVWGYEFWVEEGADVVAEQETRTIVDNLVEYIRSLQYAADLLEPAS